MLISKKYLVINTDPAAPEKQIVALDENKELLFRLQVRPAKDGIPFYLDVERFKGKSVEFLCDKKEFVFDGETECKTPTCNSFRPEIHYTVPYGWLNDPNGLIFYGGKYHIFCQHNPLSTVWGNMHWHHSVTTDFADFEHIGDVLFPDKNGTMFSGSAVCDTQNVSGLGKNAMLLFYTNAEYSNNSTAPKFTQELAYSTDSVHFTKYAGNPIVPNITGENRDPKVVFVPEMNAYVMALYLDGDEYCLLKSDNLLNWNEFQRIHIKGDCECPDLYYLKESGKWILSGAADYYIVGSFNKNGFAAEQEPVRYYCELDGKNSYAAQSFFGTHGRVLRITWENIDPENNQCFCGQMSVPAEMSLVTLNDGRMRLKASLCSEIENRLKPVQSGCAGKYITNGFCVADIESKSDFSVNIDDTELNINIKKNTISLGGKSIPLSLSGHINLRLIIDKMSIEIFADDGLIFSVIKSINNAHERIITVSGDDAKVKILKYKKQR
ncbi:MAG: glycoside hydrolase family 32 protein [Ruminococcaceae bacterium]|nr:glycoside hydrolase family 32 protein [Oscillospiraceae bacterium]